MDFTEEESQIYGDKSKIEVGAETIAQYKVFHTIVKTDDAAQMIKLSIGTHTAIDTGRLDFITDLYDNISDCIGTILKRFLRPYFGTTILICGIGCPGVIVDSLGPEVIQRINLDMMDKTSPKNRWFRKVTAIIPGVAQETRIDSALHISSVASAIGASCVLLIDAYSAKYPSELCSEIYINNVGVHNINTKNVGLPVFTIGVPTTILPKGADEKVSNEQTLIGIQLIINKAATIIGYAIMNAFYPNAGPDLCTAASFGQSNQFF